MSFMSRITPRRTLRLRMTFLYGALFLISGAALLAFVYILVLNEVSPPATADVQTARVPYSTPTAPTGRDGSAGSPGGGAPAASAGVAHGPEGQQEGQPGKEIAAQLARVMRELIISSGIALGGMVFLSVALGWIVAGRMLRPLRTVTSAARDISATSLHRRLALGGPDDEIKELGDTFDSLLNRLESSFQAQRQFVANASHELRTPLARQRVLGQIALSDPAATVESLREAHERILAAGAHQERLIEALLTLARGQAGIEVREQVDLARLVSEVVGARQAEATFRGVTLTASTAPALIAGHHHLAERLVANLVENALKYNLPGGWVRVSAGTVDGRATLAVANTGPLVPPDAVDDLFQPFLRLGAARAATGGVGLGLSIVQAITKAHDARIDVLARSEGGLAVTVTFPPMTSRMRMIMSKVEHPVADSTGE